MSGILGFIVMLSVIFLALLFYIIRYAVEDGTLNALMKYERIKNHQNKVSNNFPILLNDGN